MTTTRPPVDAWTRARERFIEDLTEEEIERFSSATLENIFYSTSAAQKTHQVTSRSLALTSKLRTLVDVFEQYGKAVDVFANAVPEIMSPLWGGIRVVLVIASEFGKYFDRLVDMLSEIGDVVPMFRAYEDLFPSHQRLVHALSQAYVDILEFCFRTKDIFKKSKRPIYVNMHIGIKILWRPFDKEFKEVIDNFRKHRERVEKEAGISHMVEESNARALVRANRYQMEKRSHEQETNRILSLLSSSRYGDRHQKLLRTRHRQKSTWLYNNDEFKAWQSSAESNLLCCFGIPGSGKTVLAANVVEYLSSTTDWADSAVGYHYCDYADATTLQTDLIFGVIIKQFLLPKTSLLQSLGPRILKVFGDDTHSPTLDDLMEVLKSVLKSYTTIHIIMDGLDECDKDTQQDLLDAITRLTELTTCTIKILVLCREDARVAAALERRPHVRITERCLKEDIRAYVEEAIRSRSESLELMIRGSSLEEEIISTLFDKSQGMFLWVSLQIEDICDPTHSAASIRKTLKHLPVGLNETYTRIMARIEENSRVFAMSQRIFKWVICAKRPLTIEELEEAIGIDPGDQSWPADKIVIDPTGRPLLQACKNLLTIDEEDGTARLVHHTVKQFLVSESAGGEPPDRFQFRYADANLYVGEICVTYLSFDFHNQLITTRRANDVARTVQGIPEAAGVNRDVVAVATFILGGGSSSRPIALPRLDDPNFTQGTDQGTDHGRGKYLLLKYVVENWVWHTMDFAVGNTSLWRRFKRLALLDSSVWETTFGPDSMHHRPILHWAAGSGHIALLRALLEPFTSSTEAEGSRVTDVNAKDDDSRPALHRAVEGKHEAVMDFLLTNGANINGTDGQGQTALHLVAPRGDEPMTELLLKRGADVNAKDAEGMSVLQRTVDSGHSAMVALLLDRGADVDVRDARGQTALHSICQRRDKAIAAFLVGRGADARGQKALDFVCQRGDEVIAELLVGKGADVNAKTRVGWSALRLAIRARNKEMMILLSRNGADLAEERNGWTPLRMAMATLDVDIVDILLSQGADVNAQDRLGWRPLHWAAWYGQLDIAELLVGYDANTSSKDRRGHTARDRAEQVGNIGEDWNRVLGSEHMLK